MAGATNLHIGLSERKIYKCPSCNQYAFHIGREKVICENKCKISTIIIDRAIETNDYKGYYLTEDLKNKFGYDYTYKLRMNKQNTQVGLYSYKEYESMNKISHRTITINNLLHDSSIKYFKEFPDRDTDSRELNQYDCLVNLVEDISVSLNRMSRDLMLMDIAFQASNYKIELMFSITYYYFNLSQHFYESMERFLICLGILFEISFLEDSKKNNRAYILKNLKKCDKYKKSEARKDIEKIMSNNVYGELISYRETSTHDISSYIKFIQNNKNSINEVEIEKEIIKRIIKKFLEMLNTQYDLLEKIISKLNLFCTAELDDNAVKMIKKTQELEPVSIISKREIKEICAKQVENNNIRLNKVNVKSNDDSMILIYDVIYRLSEILKGCDYAINLNEYYFIRKWENVQLGFILESMDRQYLIYSSAIRITSCYDKIARCLSSIYKLSNRKEIYFDTFLENVTEEDDLLKLCKEIQKEPFYLLLNGYRNDIVHIIRKGCLFLDSMDENEYYLLVAIVNNIRNIGKIVDIILRK